MAKHPDFHLNKTKCLNFVFGPINVYGYQHTLLQKHYFYKSLVKTFSPGLKMNVVMLSRSLHEKEYSGSLYEDTHGSYHHLWHTLTKKESVFTLLLMFQEKNVRYVTLSFLRQTGGLTTYFLLNHTPGYITCSYIVVRQFLPTHAECEWCANKDQYRYWQIYSENLPNMKLEKSEIRLPVFYGGDVANLYRLKSMRKLIPGQMLRPLIHSISPDNQKQVAQLKMNISTCNISEICSFGSLLFTHSLIQGDEWGEKADAVVGSNVTPFTQSYYQILRKNMSMGLPESCCRCAVAGCGISVTAVVSFMVELPQNV